MRLSFRTPQKAHMHHCRVVDILCGSTAAVDVWLVWPLSTGSIVDRCNHEMSLTALQVDSGIVFCAGGSSLVRRFSTLATASYVDCLTAPDRRAEGESSFVIYPSRYSVQNRSHFTWNIYGLSREEIPRTNHRS